MRLGYILKSFPVLSETFVINELVYLNKIEDVFVFSLFKPSARKVHSETRQFKKRTFYPLLTKIPSIISANLYFIIKNRAKYLKFLKRALSRDKSLTLKLLLASVYFARLAQKKELDYIHAHFASSQTMTAMIISQLTNIPFGFTYHAYEIFINPARELLKEYADTASIIITPSKYNRDFLRNLIGNKGLKIHIVHATIDNKKFKLRKKQSQIPNKVLFSSRLVEKKGLIYLLIALNKIRKNIPGISLNILGYGPLEKEMKEIVEKLGLEEHVNFYGSYTNKEHSKELAKSSLYVLPCIITSEGDRDVCPLTLQEAMATGTPVISTNIASIPELIEHKKSGILVKQKNEKELAKAITRLLQEKKLRQKLIIHARKKIDDEFNIYTQGRILSEIFRSAKN